MTFKTLYLKLLKLTKPTMLIMIYGLFIIVSVFVFSWPFLYGLAYSFVVGTTIVLLNTVNLTANILRKGRQIKDESVYLVYLSGTGIITRYFYVGTHGKKLYQYDMNLNSMDLQVKKGDLSESHVTIKKRKFNIIKLSEQA